VITVACVYKTGGDYTWSYVDYLAAGVRANVDCSYRFVCLSDAKRDDQQFIDEIIPLRCGWPGWWAKFELFQLDGPLLYIDLDTVVVGNIDKLIKYIVASDNILVMLRGFYKQDQCSGILGWNGSLKWVFDTFVNRYMPGAVFQSDPRVLRLTTGQRRYRGDQELLRELVASRQVVQFAQDVMTGIYSYKVNIRKRRRKREELPSDSKIVCFHGRPRPSELPEDNELRRRWCGTIPKNG